MKKKIINLCELLLALGYFVSLFTSIFFVCVGEEMKAIYFGILCIVLISWLRLN